MKDKLIKNQKKLISSLKDFNQRNELIFELGLADDRFKINKWIMAFWLGSNDIFDKLYRYHKEVGSEDAFSINFEKIKPYLWGGFSYFLLIDKAINYLMLQKSYDHIAIHKLRGIQKDSYLFYNTYFQLFLSNPECFFKDLQTLFKKWDTQGITSLFSLDFLQRFKHYHLMTFNQLLSDPCFFYENFGKYSDDRKLFPSLTINARVVEFITSNNPYLEHVFPYSDATSGYLINKQFLQTARGRVIDGLQIRKRKVNKNSIVLALYGFYPHEHYSVSKQLINYRELFDTDVLFVNHRNHSHHSVVSAKNIQELADDIVAFASHFQMKNKNIILYGLCGGASVMLLAAATLHEQKRPFKLISDRFSKNYYNFLEYKTEKRLLMHQDVYYQRHDLHSRTEELQLKRQLLCLFLICLAYKIFARLFLSFCRMDYDFGALLKKLPEEDVLVLQVKSKEKSPSGEALYTDLIIHPDNDLRTVVKEQRQGHKQRLRHLIICCERLIELTHGFEELHQVFLDIKSCLTLFIQLIDNEKLTILPTSTASTDKPTNMHSRYLFNLNTRNQIYPPSDPRHFNTQQFIRGFYSKPSMNWQALLKKLDVFSNELSEPLLCQYFSRTIALESAASLARAMVNFFAEFHQSSRLMMHLNNRCLSMNKMSLFEPFKKLMAHPLFQELNKNTMESSLLSL